MTVAEMTPFQLYSVIMTAFVIMTLAVFIWMAIKEHWFELTIPQKGICLLGTFFLYGLPVIFGLQVMAPT